MATAAGANSVIRPPICGSIPTAACVTAFMRCGLRSTAPAIDGVASFGRRPMFDTGVVLLEIFLFDFSGDLYGSTSMSP